MAEVHMQLQIPTPHSDYMFLCFAGMWLLRLTEKEQQTMYII